MEEKISDYIIGRHMDEINGGRALLTVEAADKLIGEILELLEEIASPIEFMRKGLKEGEQLNGQYAIQLSNDPHYLKSIAQKGIDKIKSK